jgi:hypothetical protein
MSRLLKAVLIGIVMGLATEYVLRPMIEKPLEKKIEEVVS